MAHSRRRPFLAKFYCDSFPFSYVLLLLLLANLSRVLLMERQMWIDIDKSETDRSALNYASFDWNNIKPFSLADVNSIMRITELDFQCSEERPPWLLVLVISRAQSRRQRDEARRTWIARLLLSERPGSVKVVFVIAVKRNPDLVIRIRDEYQSRRDMVVMLMNAIPEHPLVTTLAAFQWVNEACHGSTHILKINDDTYIDPDRFRAFVRTTAENKRYENSAVIFGQCLTNVKVDRNPQQKRFVSQIMFRDSTFPTFCTDAAYLMNQETLTLIMSNIFTLPKDRLMPFEDILITGILARPNIIHIGHPGFANVPIPPSKFCHYSKIFAHRKYTLNFLNRKRWRVGEDTHRSRTR